MAGLEHFTDRKLQIDAFDGLWQEQSPWVLVYTGLSGHGKSTLIAWLIANRCQPQDIPTKIDLFTGLNLAHLLDDLANLLLAITGTRSERW